MVKVLALVLQLSVVLVVLGIGLGTRWSDVTYLFRRPALLAKSVLARNVIVPMIAMLVITTFTLERPVAMAIAVLSVTAVPPLLPKSLVKAGGRDPYVIGLFASQSVLAIVLIPASLLAFNAILRTQAQFSAEQVAVTVGKLVLLPFAVGLLAHRFLPSFSQRIGAKLNNAATWLLVVSGLTLIVVTWRVWIAMIGNGTLFALALFVIAALATGHALGGPRDEDRSSLALATASSHPGLAMAVVSANAPSQAHLMLGVALLYLMVRGMVTQPYTRRRRGIRTTWLWRMGGDRRATIRPGADRRHVVG